MAVRGTFYRTETQRLGVTPVSPPQAGDDPISPLNPPGSNPVHDPVTLGGPANGLSLVGQQLSIGLASSGVTGVLSGTDWNTFNNKLNLTSPITGFTVGANTALTATDTILQAFGKVQGQINARVSGTIASGQVAFGTGANTIGGDSGLVWNNVIKRLLINGSTQSATLGIIGNQIIQSRTDVFQNGFVQIRQNASNSLDLGMVLESNKNGTVNVRMDLGLDSISFRTNVLNSAAIERWNITNSGVLTAIGAQTIQTTTGNLTLATGGGNGNIINSANGTGAYIFTNDQGNITISKTVSDINFSRTGQNYIRALNGPINIKTGADFNNSGIVVDINNNVGLGVAASSDKLRVNGTVRIDTINNLGTAATVLLTKSATGVISERTMAELASDGLGSKWTDGTGFIYRNGPVVIGDTSLPTTPAQPIFVVKAASTGGINRHYVQMYNFAGALDFSIDTNGITYIYNNKPRIGNPTTNIAPHGPTLKASSTNGTLSIFRILNPDESIAFDIMGSGGIRPDTVQTLGSNVATNGSTFKGKSSSAAGKIFSVVNSSDLEIIDVRGSGIINLKSKFVNIGEAPANPYGSSFKGNRSDALQIFRFYNLADSEVFYISGNGRIGMPLIPTSDPLVAGELYKYNDGTRTYICISEG